MYMCCMLCQRLSPRHPLCSSHSLPAPGVSLFTTPTSHFLLLVNPPAVSLCSLPIQLSFGFLCRSHPPCLPPLITPLWSSQMWSEISPKSRAAPHRSAYLSDNCALRGERKTIFKNDRWDAPLLLTGCAPNDMPFIPRRATGSYHRNVSPISITCRCYRDGTSRPASYR